MGFSYFSALTGSPFDWLILLYGVALIAAHVYGIWGRYRCERTIFVQDLDRYRTLCLLLTELLPMFGLLGTVWGLMQTFQTFAAGEDSRPDIGTMVQSFAPAMTTTISGLLMAIPNLVLNAIMWYLNPHKQDDGESS